MVFIMCTALAFGVIAACTVPVFFWKRSEQNIHWPRLHAVLNSHALSAQLSRNENHQESSGVESDGSSEIEIKISGLSRTKLMRAVRSGQKVQSPRAVVSGLIMTGNRGPTSTPLLRSNPNTARVDVSDPFIDDYKPSNSVRSSHRKKVETQKPSRSKKPDIEKNRVFGSATSQHFQDRIQMPQPGPSAHSAVETPTPGMSSMSNGEKAQSSSSSYNASRPETPRQRKPSSTKSYRPQDHNKPTLPITEEVGEDTVHTEEHLSPIERVLSPLLLPLLHETTPLSSRMETYVQSGAESDSSSVLNIKISGLSRSKLWNLMAKNPTTKPKRIISTESATAETPVFQSSNPEMTPNQSFSVDAGLFPCLMEESLKSSLQLDIDDWETGSDDVIGHDSGEGEDTTKDANAETDETVLPEGFSRARQKMSQPQQLGQNQRELRAIMGRSKTSEPEVPSSQSTITIQIHNQPFNIPNVKTPEPDKSLRISNVKTPELIQQLNISNFKSPDDPLTVVTIKTPEPDQLTKILSDEVPEPIVDKLSQLHEVPSTSSAQVEQPATQMSKNEKQLPNEIHHKLWRAMAGTTKYV